MADVWIPLPHFNGRPYYACTHSPCLHMATCIQGGGSPLVPSNVRGWSHGRLPSCFERQGSASRPLVTPYLETNWLSYFINEASRRRFHPSIKARLSNGSGPVYRRRRLVTWGIEFGRCLGYLMGVSKIGVIAPIYDILINETSLRDGHHLS